MITDGRFSGASRGFIIGQLSQVLAAFNFRTHPSAGHVVPEAQVGGPIALVKDGDKILVDAASRTIEWLVDDATKLERQKEWIASDHPLKVRRGVLFRYARDVAVSLRLIVRVPNQSTEDVEYYQPASEGAYCD